MKNQKVTVIQFFFDKGLRSFQSIFPRKCGESDGAWNWGLNVVALLESVNMSWLAKTTQKLKM